MLILRMTRILRLLKKVVNFVNNLRLIEIFNEKVAFAVREDVDGT